LCAENTCELIDLFYFNPDIYFPPMWLFYSSTVVSTLVTPAVSGILRDEYLAIISPAYRYRKLSMTGHFSSAVPPSPLTSLTECPSSPSIPCPSRKRRFWFSGSGSPPVPNWTSRLLVRVFQKRVGGPGAQPCSVGGLSQQHSEAVPSGDSKMREDSRSLSPEDKWGVC